MAVNGGNRIVMFFMFFFLATTIALAVYLIYEKVTEKDASIVQESIAVLKFPGYFRTKEEQQVIEREIFQALAKENSTRAEEIPNTQSSTCSFKRHFFVSPATLPNIKGEIRTIVQFNDKRQYFLTQECKHAQSCTGCRCTQENTLVNAVVENPEYPDDSEDEFVLEMLRIGGCCKCFNT